MFAIFSEAELVYHFSFTTHNATSEVEGGGSIHNFFLQNTK